MISGSGVPGTGISGGMGSALPGTGGTAGTGSAGRSGLFMIDCSGASERNARRAAGIPSVMVARLLSRHARLLTRLLVLALALFALLLFALLLLTLLLLTLLLLLWVLVVVLMVHDRASLHIRKRQPTWLPLERKRTAAKRGCVIYLTEESQSPAWPRWYRRRPRRRCRGRASPPRASRHAGGRSLRVGSPGRSPTGRAHDSVRWRQRRSPDRRRERSLSRRARSLGRASP